MAKITVKHYLNTRLKPLLIGEVVKYPVYVRVTFGRENHKIKSLWIPNHISEYEFENDRRVLNLIDYEKNMITDIIIIERESPNIQLSNRLIYSNLPIRDCFFSYQLKQNIERQLLELITSKTGISTKLIELNIGYYNYELWIESINKRIYDDETQTKTLFFKMLLEFESKNYTSEIKDNYEVSKLLNFYEWRANKAKANFINYTTERNLLSNIEVNKLVQIFDNDIFEWFFNEIPI